MEEKFGVWMVDGKGLECFPWSWGNEAQRKMFCFILRQGLTYLSPSWPQILNPFASASQVLGLQIRATMPCNGRFLKRKGEQNILEIHFWRQRRGRWGGGRG
jgi:hypothetical protein